MQLALGVSSILQPKNEMNVCHFSYVCAIKRPSFYSVAYRRKQEHGEVKAACSPSSGRQPSYELHEGKDQRLCEPQAISGKQH